MNRFDTPQGTRFNNMQTYVQMPLEAMGGLAKDYSDKYKQGLSNLDEAKGLLKVNAIDEHKPIQQELLKTYNAKLDVLADKIVKNPTDYSNQIELNKLIREYSSDPNRQELENSYKLYNQDLEALKKVKNYGYWNNTIDDFKKNYKQGEFIPYRSYGIREAEDHLKSAKEAMGKFNADSYKITNVDLKDGIKTAYTEEGKEISDNDIWNEAYNKAESWKDSPAGQDFIRKIKSDFPNASQKDIYQTIVSHLHNSASEQVFKEQSKVNDLDVTRQWDILHNEEKNKPGLPETLESNSVLSLVNPIAKKLKNKNILNDDATIDWQHNTNDGYTIQLKDGSGKKLYFDKNNYDKALEYVQSNKGVLVLNDHKGLSMEDHNEINNLIKIATKTLGKNKLEEILKKPANKINSDDYNKILSEYNNFSKAKGFAGNKLDVTFDKPYYTEDVLTSPDTYEILDSKLQPGTSESIDFKTNMFNNTDYSFNITSRQNMEGKSYLIGTLTNKSDGSTTSVPIRPKSQEYNTHYDDIAKVSDAIVKGYQSGEMKKSENPRFSNFVILAKTKTDGGRSTTYVYKNSDDQEFVVKYFGGDEKNNSEQILVGNSFKEYQQLEHNNWYKTNEGSKVLDKFRKKQQAQTLTQ